MIDLATKNWQTRAMGARTGGRGARAAAADGASIRGPRAPKARRSRLGGSGVRRLRGRKAAPRRGGARRLALGRNRLATGGAGVFDRQAGRGRDVAAPPETSL